MKKKKFDKERLHNLYMELWKDRKVRGRNYSEISGKLLPKEPLSIFFHHILCKNKYEDLIFEPDNIIIVTFEEHQEIENCRAFEEVEKRKLKLLERLRNDKNNS
jgi:hypothetical protein